MKKKTLVVILCACALGMYYVSVRPKASTDAQQLERLLINAYQNGAPSDGTNRFIKELALKHGDRLISMLCYKEGTVMGAYNTHILMKSDSEYQRHQMAIYGFHCLGTNGVKHLPELRMLLQQKKCDMLAVAQCIGAVGEEGGKVLFRELSNDDMAVKKAAIMGLIVLDTIPHDYLESVLALSKNMDVELRICVARLCARHGKQSNKALNVLLTLLDDTDTSVVEKTIMAVYVENWRDERLIKKLQFLENSSVGDLRAISGRALMSMTNNEAVILLR